MDDVVRVLQVGVDVSLADAALSGPDHGDVRFAVDHAEMTADALELCEGVDCVVSEQVPPGTDGIDLLRRVRERHPVLPSVLYTDGGSEAVASEAISAGVTDCLRRDDGGGESAVPANRVHNAVEQVRSRHPDADAEATVPDGVVPRGIPELEDAMVELLDDAVVHAGGMGLWVVTYPDGFVRYEENDPRGSVVVVELAREEG